MEGITIKDGVALEEAWALAFRQGLFTEQQATYGDYMYMFSKDGQDWFKNTDTRDYVKTNG